MTAKEAIAEARALVSTMKMGGLTYDECKSKCIPLFEIANSKGREIAKKFNKRYSDIVFASFAR